MNLAAVSLLSTRREAGIWHRAVDARYLTSAISTTHTVVVPSRFYDPYAASPQFRTLYLSDHRLVAMFEAQALFGSPTNPGGSVSGPGQAWALLTVQVQLDVVVDFSAVASQTHLATSVQELTGDWQGYRTRSIKTNVTVPTGSAPTQMLGEAVYQDGRDIEGLVTVSAKVPTNRNLVAFPEHFRATSFVLYQWTDSNLRDREFRVDRNHPDGIPL